VFSLGDVILGLGCCLLRVGHRVLEFVFCSCELAVCGLFAGTFWLMLRARLDALAALTAVIVIFSLTHFVLRQPIIWFALVLSLILGTSRGANVGSTGR